MRRPACRSAGERGIWEENDMTGGLTWDFVTLMSLAMVVIAILIIVFLVYKVITLMNRDAEAHKNNEI
jgi:uncharacterized membrane protein